MTLISKTKSFPLCGTDIRRGKVTFSQLVKDIRDALGSSPDLCSNDIGLDHILELMSLYMSSEPEWARYAFKNTAGQYARNLVDEGNGRGNLVREYRKKIDKFELTLKAYYGMESQRNKSYPRPRSCALCDEGSLKESLYEMPNEGSRCPPRLVREAHLAENQVTHISDQIGIHKISNTSATEFAVSLHLYTPPYATNFGFHVFDEVNGEPRHITQANLTSDRGVKLEK